MHFIYNLIVKLSLTACAIYMAFATIGYFLIIEIAKRTGGVMLVGGRGKWSIYSALLWLIAYNIAWSLTANRR